ncbi:MAG: ABC transporter permease [Planctomycetes bacterium]|nr:ABC transporter permease [Planctomycetota bacterium]
MATVGPTRPGPIIALGGIAYHAVTLLGDFTLFSLQTLGWMARRRPTPGTVMPSFYLVGVRSVPVVAITGMFIGMVMAVQMYNQFNKMGMATRIGSMINITIVRELGPVLAATMLAGRVGSAMAAELATMRVTEQVDALSCLGAHPLHYLVVPRLLACGLLIPLLTVMADFMGVMGGAFICTRLYGVEAHYYWAHTAYFVSMWDVSMGLIKAFFFGCAIALISCHRGLNSQAGAEGVGRSATEAFVLSFVVILVLDFFLAILLINLYDMFILKGMTRTFL